MKVQQTWAVAASVGACFVFGASAAVAQERKFDGVIITDKAQCEQASDAIWIEHPYQNVCVRYYPSKNLKNAKQAIVYFHGDRNNRNWTAEKAVEALKEEEEHAQKTGIPSVTIGRVGMYGTTGDPLDKRSRHAFEIALTALNTVIKRYNLKDVAIAGQSGGANTVANMLNMGFKTRCAASTSGGYKMKTNHRDVYSAFLNVPSMQVDKNRRQFVIGSPLDKTTPWPQQDDYFKAVQAAGHHAVQVQVYAPAAAHHSAGYAARPAAAWCLKGLSDADVVKNLRELSRATAAKEGGADPVDDLAAAAAQKPLAPID